MNKDRIIQIVKLDNVQIENTHNGYKYPLQNVLEIDFANGKFRMIDLFSQKDITDIDYFKVVPTSKTKKKYIFKEYNDTL